MKKWQRSDLRLLIISGLAVLLFVLAILGEWLAPYDPLEVNYALSLKPPDNTHWFGTDKLGRDILSRVLCGAKTSFSLTLMMLAVIVVVGLVIGLVCGYVKGWTDHIIMRIADILLAFPDTIFAIAVAGILGAGVFHTVFALALVWWTKYARLTRSLVIDLSKKDYICAARLAGAGHIKILFVYILPEILPKILVNAALDTGSMMLSLAGLSFLGLASQPPSPEWGYMLYESKQFMQTAPWMMFYPGCVLLMTVMIFNLLGDCLRDKLDPKSE